jgi:hypothetical protein
MKIKKYNNHFSIKIGGVNGENFMILIAVYKGKPHTRITICFNTDKLIKIFGFNQKNIEF